MIPVQVITGISKDGKSILLETYVDGKPLAHALLTPDGAENVAGQLQMYAQLLRNQKEKH